MKKILMKILMKVKLSPASGTSESAPGFDLEIAFHDQTGEAEPRFESVQPSHPIIEVVPLKPFASSGQ